MDQKLPKSIGGKFLHDIYLSILLILELADYNSVQTLLNPPQVLSLYPFLLGGYTAFANEGKGSCTIDSFPYNHNTINGMYC